jgi:hypothetical protein
MRSRFLTVALVMAAALLSSGAAFAGEVIIHIPEPSSLGILAAGVGIAAWLKFRGQK